MVHPSPEHRKADHAMRFAIEIISDTGVLGNRSVDVPPEEVAELLIPGFVLSPDVQAFLGESSGTNSAYVRITIEGGEIPPT
jgi:hypothetical protein